MVKIFGIFGVIFLVIGLVVLIIKKLIEFPFHFLVIFLLLLAKKIFSSFNDDGFNGLCDDIQYAIDNYVNNSGKKSGGK